MFLHQWESLKGYHLKRNGSILNWAWLAFSPPLIWNTQLMCNIIFKYLFLKSDSFIVIIKFIIHLLKRFILTDDTNFKKLS